MSYEAVLEQIKNAPEACLDEISQIISYVVYRYEKENEEFNDVTKAALEEVEQMKKNPSLGKSYTDVDQMMQELLA
ncbi:MAG: hypothetical protein J5798_03645 [Spirochaetaceae bacterium]|nr:hypothetical protein [Spirochaetaceae bacterium]